jgi:hypothetical protein
MKLLKILIEGLFLAFGFAFLLLAVATSFKSNKTQEDIGSIIGCLFWGVPSIFAGIYSIQNSILKERARKEKYLRGKFYELLREQKGRISVLDLAMKANISITEAKKNLDVYAKEFNANFEISETATIIYKFLLD